MKRTNATLILLSIMLVLALTGCDVIKSVTTDTAKNITTGSFEGNTYTNEYFGLSFTVPDGWTIATKDEMKQIFQAGADAIGSDDEETEKKLKLAEAKTLYLAYALKHPLDYADGFNPNINAVCENLSVAGLVIKTSGDYMDAAIKNLASAMEGYTFSDAQTKTIAGAEFSVVDAVLDYSGVEIKQQLVCTLKNNYAILFTLTYLEDAEMDELQKIVDSISFGK